MIDKDENPNKFKAAIEYYTRENIKFRIVSEDELFIKYTRAEILEYHNYLNWLRENKE